MMVDKQSGMHFVTAAGQEEGRMRSTGNALGLDD